MQGQVTFDFPRKKHTPTTRRRSKGNVSDVGVKFDEMKIFLKNTRQICQA